ncbi:MAG TPA: aspartyl protease family protein [Candidatus Acidoferrum sp.]|nr:aspartyl protease family protein [Candidatus Acidoferrum sp.]
MILLDATVNGTAAVLLLDTGADNSIMSPSVAGVSANLSPLKAGNGAGASGGLLQSED